MIHHLLSAMHAHEGLVSATQAQPCWGIVTDVDPVNHLVKVSLQPELETGPQPTGWLPVPTLGIGGGGGLRYIPVEGSMAFLVPDGNDPDAFVVKGFASNDQDKHPDCPNAIGGGPAKAQAGEAILVGPDGGAWLRTCKDGSILIGSKTVVNIDAPTVNVSKDLNVGGVITAQGNIISKADVSDMHNTLAHLRATVNGHTHNGVQPGSGISGKLIVPD